MQRHSNGWRRYINGVCANCHGTLDQPGSLPTSLRFAEGKFKNGSDPLSMYHTLTHGFGLMAPQSWMVPFKNMMSSSTYAKPISRGTILRSTQKSTQVSGEASSWRHSRPERAKSNHGLIWTMGRVWLTFEVTGGEHNFAYKGVAVRLDPGSGVSREEHIGAL